jgi:hypothetical protein
LEETQGVDTMSKTIWLDETVQVGKMYRNTNGLDYYCIDVNYFPNEAIFHCGEDNQYVIAKRPKLLDLINDDGSIENGLLVWDGGSYYHSLKELKEFL